MKKYFSMIALALISALSFVACSTETNEDAGGTYVEKLAGQWKVQIDVIDDNGNVLYEDPYAMGDIYLYTFNTAANQKDTMWVSDEGNFWGMKMKVAVDLKNATFSAAAGTPYDEAGTGTVDMLEGKVLFGQGKNVNGMPCDSISLKVKYSDDNYGFVYHISGTRFADF